MAEENTTAGADFDMKTEAFTQLAQGKRHLLVKDYSEAVTSLALACEYLAKIFGDTATECVEAYFNYGKALLELARTENGVLGNAVEDKDGSPSEEGDEEEEKLETKPDENETDPSEKDGQSANSADEDPANPKVETAVNCNGDMEEGVTNGDCDTPTKEALEGDEVDDPEEDEDNVSNLHLAWEILELAQLIYQREAAKDESVELKLAAVKLKLGEVALESENYSGAIQDMNGCLELQMKHLKKDDRCVAETYYQIGIAYSLANEFDNAISAFASCGKLLELRISNLKQSIKDGVKPEGDDPFYTMQGEIEELESLFPEIKEKIFDMQDFKKETLKAMMGHKSSDASDAGAGSSKDETTPFPAPSASTSKPVSNIGHLVRKKRKSECEDDDSAAAKRVCSDPKVKQ